MSAPGTRAAAGAGAKHPTATPVTESGATNG